MPQFKYIIINSQGKKLSGVIEGKKIEEARIELNNLGFSVIDIDELTEATNDTSGNLVFEFEAIDKLGKKVVGTIAGIGKYDAFKRLIKEYDFDVESICTASATLDQKEQEKSIGVVDLYTRYKKEETEEESSTGKVAEKMNAEMKKQKEKYLNDQVNFVSEKVKTFLSEMGAYLKPEEKKEIEKNLNHLLRIRASTNLDYIRDTAEELLKNIQKQEIFTTEHANEKKAKEYALDARKMLSDIHKEGLRGATRQQYVEKIKAWQKKNITENESPTWFLRLQNFFLDAILDVLEEPPEITAIKDKLRVIKSQIADYTIMALKENNPDYKEDLKKSLETLKDQYGKTKDELNETKHRISEQLKEKREYTLFEVAMREISTLSGWLLFFYFGFFALGNYFTEKKILEPVPGFFLTSSSYIFEFILGIVFLIHISTTTKALFFQKNAFANIIIFPIFIIFITLTVFNF